jgi:Flp pilus assembly protein CpaB
VRLRRHPLSFWPLAVGLALLTGLTVARLVGEASARAARLGGLRAVPVAARPVDAGQRLSDADVAVRRLPAALLPSGPVASAPEGHAALVPITAGEVLLEAKLAPWGARGVAALVPPGRRALAVPVEGGGLPLGAGDHVDVLATFEAAEDGGDPTFPVATAALVVDVAEGAVTVAVSQHEAPRVAFAIARGTVILALSAP